MTTNDEQEKNSPSPMVARQAEIEDKKTYAMTEEETEQYVRLCARVNHARSQRSMNRDEFDGMTYEQYYLTNQRANTSYLAPKINNDDVRINTGTTEKKVEYVLNQVLALNLTGEVLAYDKDDNLMEDVSTLFTDLVLRTEEIERAKDKDTAIILELLSQPCVFVEELWTEKQIRGTDGKLKTVRHCERQLLQGPQIYLGDLNLPDYRFNEQPFIIKYFRITYDEAETLFGDWDRWEYVCKGSYNTLQPVPYQIYRKGSLLSEEVEGYIYMSAQDREYQILLQGVPMFSVGEDLPWEWDGYNISMVGLKPFHNDFAYSKPLTAASKTLQALDNEMLRNFIRKMRQAIEPPSGVPSGKVYSRDIWSPGAMTQGITKDSISKLIDHQGVTASEFQMMELIDKKINEFLGTDALGALMGGSRLTATQIQATQKIALQMIGLAVIAATRLEAELTMLRTKNILSHYTEPTGKEVDPITDKLRDSYARFTIQDTDIGNNQNGSKVIQFASKGLNQDELGKLFAHQNKMAKAGKPVKYQIVDANALSDLDLYFHTTATPQPADAKELEKSMYQEELTQAEMVTQLTGRPLNADKVTEKFERIWNSRDLFEKQAPMQGASPMMPGQPGQQAGGAVIPTQPAPQGPQQPPQSTAAKVQPRQPRPTVNTLANA